MQVQRKTRQKQAVQEAFASAGRPLSPQEVASLAQETVPSLGIATAYRAIKELVDARWLISVATPAGTRFELADLKHHHHFFCRDCSQTYDIEGCVGDVEQFIPQGFVAEGHELTITGQCKACKVRRRR
jgi:Fur family ferric uptake transcriptional regulator